MATNEELTQMYQAVRGRVLDMGRSLNAEQAVTMSPCCPEWSVKGLFAHLAGVPVDVLEGNIAEAATAPWADAHLARRAHDSLAQILDELEATTEQMDGLLNAMASDIDPRFFFDAWTHEWDIRQALDLEAVPDIAIPQAVLPKLVEMLGESNADHPAITLVVDAPSGEQRHHLGSGESTGELTVSLFELCRVSVGRRSRAQISSLGPLANPDQLVYFTAAPVDIVDPVLAAGSLETL